MRGVPSGLRLSCEWSRLPLLVGRLTVSNKGTFVLWIITIESVVVVLVNLGMLLKPFLVSFEESVGISLL